MISVRQSGEWLRSSSPCASTAACLSPRPFSLRGDLTRGPGQAGGSLSALGCRHDLGTGLDHGNHLEHGAINRHRDLLGREDCLLVDDGRGLAFHNQFGNPEPDHFIHPPADGHRYFLDPLFGDHAPVDHGYHPGLDLRHHAGLRHLAHYRNSLVAGPGHCLTRTAAFGMPAARALCLDRHGDQLRERLKTKLGHLPSCRDRPADLERLTLHRCFRDWSTDGDVARFIDGVKHRLADIARLLFVNDLELGLHDRLGASRHQVHSCLGLHHRAGNHFGHAFESRRGGWRVHTGGLLADMARADGLAGQRACQNRGQKPPRPNCHGNQSPG